MSNKWILLCCFVLVTMGAADGRKNTAGSKNSKNNSNNNSSDKGTPAPAPPGCRYCRDKDGCKKGGSCPSGCYTGWATKQCKNSTFFDESCKYIKKNVTCDEKCPQNWDGPYCSRENVVKKQNETRDCENTNKREIQLRHSTDNPVIELFPGSSGILNISDCDVRVSSKKKGTDECPCTHLPTSQTFDRPHLFTCQDGKCSKTVKFLTVDCGGRTKPPPLCLSEIKVYSCKKFWFGPETGCRSHCNCQNGAPCNSMSGECPRQNPCADGFFGTNCSLACGPCEGNITCNKTTGQCPHQILTDLSPSTSTSSEPETSTSSSTSTSPSTLTSTDSTPATPPTFSTQVMDTSGAVASSGSTSDTSYIFSATSTALPQISTLTVAPPSISGNDSVTVTPSALPRAVSEATLGVADSASSVTEDLSIPTAVLTTSITSTIPDIDLSPSTSTSSEPETSTSSSISTSPSTLTSTDSTPATPPTFSTQVMDTSGAVASSGFTSDTSYIFSETSTALPQTSTLTVAPPSTSGNDSMTVTPSALPRAVSEISTLGVADSASSVTEDSSVPTTVLTTSITSTIPDISDKLSTDSVVSDDLFTVESVDSNATDIVGVIDTSLSTVNSSLSLGEMVGYARKSTDRESSVANITFTSTADTNMTAFTTPDTTDEHDFTTSEKNDVENAASVTHVFSTPTHFSGESSTGRTSTITKQTQTSPTPSQRTTTPNTMHKISTQTTPQTTHTSSTHQTSSETVSAAAPTTQKDKSTSKPRESTTSDKKDGGSTEYTVAGVLFGLAACVLVAIIAFVLVYRRSMRRKMNTSCEQPIVMENPWDNNHSGAVTMSSLLQNEAQEDTAVYANCGQKFQPTVTPIPVGNFRNHIGYLESTGGYAKEFQALPTDLLGAVEAATRSLDANVRKNRFKDICPYDDTRVVLATEKDSDSDYINASYIDGFAEARAYIAAQGPLPDTVGDFWHMVWTEGCGKIIMLTNLCESGKVKCEQYWPNEENSTTTFGHYTVTLVSVTTRAFFVQRTLRVVKNTSQNGDGDRRRHIHHFHFTAWPDHNVPLAAPMVEFWEAFHHVPSGLSGPLLVHCSAGVGRTGTFVGLDILIRQAETTDSISVFPTVRRMRQQRVKMVQTLSQYVFLHEVLDEWLSSRDTVVSLHDLQHDPAWCLNDGGQLTDTVRAKIAAQFQLLDRLRPRPSKKLTDTALRPENASKNRVAHILPMEHCRVCLWSPEEEDSDYINAVFLPSMSTQLGFIVTQLPLRHTAADFWHMVYDWKAKIVVRFRSMPEQESDLALCPAEGCRAKFGPVTVGNDCVSPWKPGITEITLQLQNEEVEEHTQMVKVYSVDHDMTSSLTDTSPFLTLADHLLPIVGSLPQPPVVVQCFDGVGLSCTLCAVVMALQTLQVDRRASPYTLARTLQTCRPQAFPTLVQYECMVRCLLDHARGRQTAGDAVNPTDAANGNEETSPPNAIYANV